MLNLQGLPEYNKIIQQFQILSNMSQQQPSYPTSSLTSQPQSIPIPTLLLPPIQTLPEPTCQPISPTLTDRNHDQPPISQPSASDCLQLSSPHIDSVIVTMIHLNQEIVSIANRVSELENRLLAAEEKNPDPTRKKFRRKAQQIQRDHNCPYDNCGKRYGSEVSLNLHIRLKHSCTNKQQRENCGVQSAVIKQTKTQQTQDPRFMLPADVLKSIEEEYQRLNQKLRRS